MTMGPNDVISQEDEALGQALMVSLKEFGLEGTVRKMTVPQRGDARRLIRKALNFYLELNKRAA
jgi:hypothetical protein